MSENQNAGASLARKIVAMQKACGYVQKTGNNASQGYRYASAADVLSHVNAAACEAGVASFPDVELLSCEQVPTRNGTTNLATVRLTLDLVCTDTGESKSVRAVGQGADPGDKAAAKAETMALKYAWMMTLNIATGDDPEGDERTDNEHAPAPQRSQAPRQPQPARNGAPSAQNGHGRPQGGDDPRCPKCGGYMWDNRAKKASGEMGDNRPDFSCKKKGSDPECKGAIWPPREGNGNGRAPARPAQPEPEEAPRSYQQAFDEDEMNYAAETTNGAWG